MIARRLDLITVSLLVLTWMSNGTAANQFYCEDLYSLIKNGPAQGGELDEGSGFVATDAIVGVKVHVVTRGVPIPASDFAVSLGNTVLTRKKLDDPTYHLYEGSVPSGRYILAVEHPGTGGQGKLSSRARYVTVKPSMPTIPVYTAKEAEVQPYFRLGNGIVPFSPVPRLSR